MKVDSSDLSPSTCCKRFCARFPSSYRLVLWDIIHPLAPRWSIVSSIVQTSPLAAGPLSFSFALVPNVSYVGFGSVLSRLITWWTLSLIVAIDVLNRLSIVRRTLPWTVSPRSASYITSIV